MDRTNDLMIIILSTIYRLSIYRSIDSQSLKNKTPLSHYYHVRAISFTVYLLQYDTNDEAYVSVGWVEQVARGYVGPSDWPSTLVVMVT